MFYNHLISYNFFKMLFRKSKNAKLPKATSNYTTLPLVSCGSSGVCRLRWGVLLFCVLTVKRQRHEIFNPRHDSSPSGPIIHMRMYFYTWFRFRGNIFAYLFDFAEIFAYLKNSALSMTPHNFFCMTALGQSCFLLTSGSF